MATDIAAGDRRADWYRTGPPAGASVQALPGLAWVVRLSSQLTWFGVVGVCATLCYAGVMSVTISGLSWQPLVGNALAYLLSTLVSYFGHKWLTFRSRVAHHRAMPKFLAQAGIGYLYASICVHGVAILQWPYWIGIAVVTTSLPVLNFVVFNKIVFAERRSDYLPGLSLAFTVVLADEISHAIAAGALAI